MLVQIPIGALQVEGMLEMPARPLGLVLFAHGSGSSRLSVRNNHVAVFLRQAGLGTLLIDLLTLHEDRHYQARFDIDLLTHRLDCAAAWLIGQDFASGLPLGLFGASTGAAAALRVAAKRPSDVAALVSRGGRPDLAGEEVIVAVQAPCLLIVGGADRGVIEWNQAAYNALHCEKRLAVIPGATHLFEEPGTLDEVAMLAASWFEFHFREIAKKRTRHDVSER
jgi:putative phosphoribosyl transferase